MRKEYTINELTEIFGCSRTAIVKKIKPDENNPVLKRYKGLYDVVTSNGNMAILFDDEDLEHEKKLSKGFKNVSPNTVLDATESDIVDVEPEKENRQSDTVINFTQRYISEFTTFQKEMYNELRQRDNQILLLTTSEKTKEEEYFRTQTENKTLKVRNKVLTVILAVMITLFIILITVYITTTTLQHNVAEPEVKTDAQEIQTIVIPADKNKKLPNKK